MQFATDTDLAAALAQPDVQIRPKLEIDWYRNGAYTHAYSDVSALISEVGVDFATIQGDLPAEINVLTGSSSSQLTAVLSGRRNSDELPAAQLFSDFWGASPLYGIVKLGTPIRYSRRVKVAGSGDGDGWKTIRQFTGWINKCVPDEESGTVTITATDVYDLQTDEVTLPVWGIGPQASSNLLGLFDNQGRNPTMRPIETQWVYEEILRQAGRPVWPGPRNDGTCIAFWSCSGSLLPSIGSLAELTSSYHGLTWYQNPWQKGAYGLKPSRVTMTSQQDQSLSYIRTEAQLFVPPNATGSGTVGLAFGCWASLADGPSVVGPPTEIRIYIQSGYLSGGGGGYASMQINNNGTVTLTIPDVTGASGATTRIWGWNPSLTMGQDHYFWLHIAFTNNSITPTLYVDDVVQTPSSSSGLSGGFRYGSGSLMANEIGNWATLSIGGAPVYSVQICRSQAGAITYDPTVKNGPSPARAVIDPEGSMTELSWLPDINRANPWEVLKQAVGAEFGVLHTDEQGVVYFKRRDTVWFDTLINYYDAPILPRDTLINGLNIADSIGVHKNTISISATKREQVRAFVWSNDDPLRFFIKDGMQQSVAYPLNDVVALEARIMVEGDGNPPTTGSQPVNRNSIFAIRADNLTLGPSNTWGAGTNWTHRQREIQLAWAAQQVGTLIPTGRDLYVGAYLGGEQACWFIGGTKLSNAEVSRTVWADAEDLAAHGILLLEIPDSPWRQSDDVSETLAESLLRSTTSRVPTLQGIEVKVDPRRQLLDPIRIPPGGVVDSYVHCRIVGKRIKDTLTTQNDEIDIRVVTSAAVWDSPQTGWDVGYWDN